MVRESVDQIGIQIAGRIYVAHHNGVNFAGSELLGADVRSAESVARRRQRAHVQGVGYLEVVAQPFLHGDFGPFEVGRKKFCEQRV